MIELSLVKVAVGVVMDSHHNVLITRRSLDSEHAGFWEFPGGKVEPYEIPEEALQRELLEEVGLCVVAYDYLGVVQHVYAHRSVSLLVFHVHQFQGEAQCMEKQLDLRWVRWDTLSDFQFPDANLKIIKLVEQARSDLLPS